MGKNKFFKLGLKNFIQSKIKTDEKVSPEKAHKKE